MERDLHSIGELARASGLSISALRFYDRSGVLPPALVDPVTGYRWYTGEQVLPARLVAGLRRVGMPLADIAAALRQREDRAAVTTLLDGHLRRMEEELAQARRELAGVRRLLESEGTPAATRVELPRGELRAALGRVRFAVGTDPALPMLGAVLVDVDPEGVRLVATDRYRMAFGRARGRVTGPPVRALVPVDAVDALTARLADTDEPVTVQVRAGWVTVDRVGEPLRCAVLPYEFPGYQQLLRPVADRPVRRVPVRVAALTRALRDAPTVLREHAGVTHRVTVLGLHDRRGVRPLGAAELAGGDPAGLRVGVNGGYLREALAAAGAPELVLELTGPAGPLTLRRPGEAETCSLLMPIRL